jgi:hypothetical protein
MRPGYGPDAPSQRVIVCNTSTQPYIIYDHMYEATRFEPGEHKEIVLTLHDIGVFREMAVPGRKMIPDYAAADKRGGIPLVPSKPIPLVITDIPQPDIGKARELAQEATRAAKAAPPTDIEQIVKAEQPVEPAKKR